jgi:uncharacterized protein YfaS (alpha-2-macroglobulin family)
LLISPFPNAFGTLQLECGGIVHTENIEMKDETHIINFEIKKEWIPSLRIIAELNGTHKLENGLIPSIANGETKVDISTKIHQLDITAEPSSTKVMPGEEIKVDLAIIDHLGKPKENIEVCLIVVDESVLLFAKYDLENPLSHFYPSITGNSSYLTNKSKICTSKVEESIQIGSDNISFEIYIKTLTGKTTTVFPDIESTVQALKLLIEDKEGIFFLFIFFLIFPILF